MNPTPSSAAPRPASAIGSPDWFANAPVAHTPDTRPSKLGTVQVAVVVVSVIAGVTATFGGPSPTGAAAIDAVVVALAVGMVTWLGAAALRWDMAVAAIVSGIASWSIVGGVIGFFAGVGGYAIPARRGFKSVITAGMVGVALNLLCRSQLDWFFGASSIIGISIGTTIAVIGLRRRTPATRRTFRIGALVAIPLALVGALGLAYGAWTASEDLRTANRQAELALDQLGDGDIDAAQASFTAAAAAFERAGGALSNPAAQLARFVPVVAQHRTVAVELSTHAADASTVIAEQLEQVDLDSLTVTDGRIDVDQVRALQAPLLAIQNEIESLEASISAARSPWLVPGATGRIDTLADDVAAQRQRGEDALAIAIAAPALLGGDGPRVYFIAFTTPAEARGLGGFMGNWAEMTVDDGTIELTKFGRTEDLEVAAAPGTRFVSGPSDWLSRYGLFQFTNGENGSTGSQPWHNVTMSPNMESTAQVIAELYPQSGGQALDGVFSLDVYTLARFLEFTGPIALPEGSGPVDGGLITSENAAKFLLNDQYDQTELDERIDVLETFSRTVVDALLTGSLPPPTDLLDVLGPMVDQGRFAAYSVHPEEQNVLRRIGLSGTLPILDGSSVDSAGAGSGDAIAIAFNNAVGNKIDYYLASSATYSVIADGTTDTAAATLEVVMTNTAPLDGEPGYVIGNPVDLPIGENRTYVSVFTRLPVVELMVDGKPVDAEPGIEAGYFVTSAFIQLPAGQSATLSFKMSGPLALAEGYTLAARTPPSVAPTPINVDVAYTATTPEGTSTEHVTASRHDPGTLRLSVGTPAD